MEDDLLKLNMLTIAASGLMMLLSGLVLYFFISGTIREVFISSLFALGVFTLFVVLNISITYLLKRIF
jgi:hypothetical protein